MQTGTAPPRAGGKHAPWLPPCFDTMNERKITVRNVDKIKELKKKLAEAERYAARLETMCKGQDKQLMEVQLLLLKMEILSNLIFLLESLLLLVLQETSSQKMRYVQFLRSVKLL